MAIRKSHVYLSLVNSYLIDVRCERGLIVRYSSNYDCHNIIASIKLGNSERELLNIASLFKGLFYLKLLRGTESREVSIMVKAILLKDKFQMFSKVGKPHCSNRWFLALFSTSLLDNSMTAKAYNIINIRNEMSYQPKMEYKLLNLTAGLPKGRNSYGNRATVVSGLHKAAYEFMKVNWRKSVAVSNIVSVRKYSTDVQPKVFTKLDSLTNYCLSNKDKVVDRKIYNILCDPYFLQYAYNSIKSKPGNMTPGINPETLDGLNWDWFVETSESLKQEKFAFKPGRRILMDKSSGGKRPLTIAPPRDKIVQAGMKIILNAIYEPVFLESSHGFRPNKSCHTALKFISQKFKSSVWFIEGDISKCFDSIEHRKLMDIIESKIKDRQFTKLIFKSLRAGYFEFKVYKSDIVGTPQGSIISPILSNIFMHQLDVYVNSLKEEFDIGTLPKLNRGYRHIVYLMSKAKAKNDMGEFKKQLLLLRKVNSVNFSDPSYKRLNYVRYADDWIIGIRGSYKDSQLILKKVTAFCSSIGLTISPTKTKITNLMTDRAKFLGVYITRSTHVKISKYKNIVRRIGLRLRFEVSISDINKVFLENSFLKNGSSHPKFLWYHLEHRQIITLYNSVLRGLINYYGFVHNYGKFAGYVYMTLKFSCAKLLAAKYKMTSMKKVFDKFGADLTIHNTNAKGKVSTYSFYKPTWKINTNRYLINSNPIINTINADNISLAKLDDLSCNICGSNFRVELHHIRKMKDLNPKLSLVDRLMAKTNRKQIPLCRECHMKLHPNRR